MPSGNITLLQINDTHAYLEPHPELFWQGGEPALRTSGGFARIASIFRRVREETGGRGRGARQRRHLPRHLRGGELKGEALIDGEPLGLDAMTAHWDFAYGPEQFDGTVSRLDHPMLAINCYRKDSGELAYPPYRIVDRGGLKVGVVGIAATIVDKTMPEHFGEGYASRLATRSFQGMCGRFARRKGRPRRGALPPRLPAGREDGGRGPGRRRLLSGHTHNRLHEPFFVNGLIIQSGCHGSFVGRLDLEVEGGKVAMVRHELSTWTRSDPEDPMKAAVDRRCAGHRAMLGERSAGPKRPAPRHDAGGPDGRPSPGPSPRRRELRSRSPTAGDTGLPSRRGR